MYTGTREEMEERYGHLSHLMIDKEFNLELFRLARKRVLGPRLYNSMSQVAVIVLE